MPISATYRHQENIRGEHFRTGAEGQFRRGIGSEEPADKKVQNEGCGTIKNNFRTDRKLFPFKWQYCTILVLIFERLKNGNIVPF